jgi:hypothetical protein
MAEAIRRPTSAPALVRPSVRVGALPSLPPHVGTMFGLSIAGYGVALAVVTGLQASSESAINADRAPLAGTIEAIAARHDRLEDSLRGASDAYAAAAAGYQSMADRLSAIDDGLASLAASVKAVDGASKALPASVALPPVVRSVRVAPRAVTHATTGGSAAP